MVTSKLQLRKNSLSGTIPSEIGGMTPLLQLFLDSNRLARRAVIIVANPHSSLAVVSGSLSGSIPDTLTQLTNLEYLELSSNVLDGHVPANMGNMGALVCVHCPSPP
jgi:hypothetical protein